jgi:catechol 2,3-dioxygenase-like lactoylglutathione lyase family enzyme
MPEHLHHVHLFATDVDKSIAFWRDNFGGEVVLDAEMAGARNVFMRVGAGRLHFYDQPPRDQGRGAVHHLGVQTDDLEALVARLRAAGVEFRKPIADFGVWKYVMAAAPDGVLLELFEVNRAAVPAEMQGYFL